MATPERMTRLASLYGQHLPYMYPFTPEEHKALENLQKAVDTIFIRTKEKHEIDAERSYTYERLIYYPGTEPQPLDLDFKDPNLTLEIDPDHVDPFDFNEVSEMFGFDPIETQEFAPEIEADHFIPNETPQPRKIILNTIEDGLHELISTSNRIKSISFEIIDPAINQTFFIEQSFPTQITHTIDEYIPDENLEENEGIVADIDENLSELANELDDGELTNYLPGFLKPFADYSSERYIPDPLLNTINPIPLTTRDDIPEGFEGASVEDSRRIQSIAIFFLEYIQNVSRMAIAYCPTEISDIEVLEDLGNVDQRIKKIIFTKNDPS